MTYNEEIDWNKKFEDLKKQVKTIDSWRNSKYESELKKQHKILSFKNINIENNLLVITYFCCNNIGNIYFNSNANIEIIENFYEDYKYTAQNRKKDVFVSYNLKINNFLFNINKEQIKHIKYILNKWEELKKETTNIKLDINNIANEILNTLKNELIKTISKTKRETENFIKEQQEKNLKELKENSNKHLNNLQDIIKTKTEEYIYKTEEFNKFIKKQFNTFADLDKLITKLKKEQFTLNTFIKSIEESKNIIDETKNDLIKQTENFDNKYQEQIDKIIKYSKTINQLHDELKLLLEDIN